jgi:hypothetical protein
MEAQPMSVSLESSSTRFLGVLLLTVGISIGQPGLATAQDAPPAKSEGKSLLGGIECLAKIFPGGKIVGNSIQLLFESGETTAAILGEANKGGGELEIKPENIEGDEPLLTEETVGFRIGGEDSDLGTCTVLGSLVKGPQTDFLRAIVGYERDLLEEFEEGLQFYVNDPRPVRDKRLKGCGFHYGEKVCVGLTAQVYEDGPPDIADGWVRLSGGKALPDSLERRGIGSPVFAKVLLNFGNLTLTSTDIPFSELSEGGQISLRKMRSGRYDKVKSFLREESVSAKIILRDPSGWQTLTGDSGFQSGTVQLNTEGTVFPPASPALSAVSKRNTVKLTLSGQDADKFRVYRSTESGFSISDVEPLDVIDGNMYTDEGLAAGRTYYYKAIAVSSSGQTSNPSSEVSGRLETNYKFSGLGEREISRDAYSLGTLSGQLKTVQDGAPVPGADVSLSIPAIELSVDEVKTGDNGEFSIEYRVPGEPGNYKLRLNARPEEGARTLELSLGVQDRPEWGRDLAISELGLNDSLVTGGETIEIEAKTENRGDTGEEATVSYRLRDRSGEKDASTTLDPSLAPGEEPELFAYLSLPDGLAAGSYQLQSSIENDAALDRKWANNRATEDVYAPSEPYSSSTYRSAARTIEGEGSTKTIDGTDVTLLSVTETSVEFEVGGEATGSLPIDGNSQPPWTSSAEDFLILKEGISAVGDTVTFEGGGTASEASVSPGRIQEKRGRETAFEVKVPEGQTPEPSEMTYPYGPDAGTLENWTDNAGDDFLDPRTAALGLEVSPSAQLREYSGWLKWGGSPYGYYKKVVVRPRPIHDLALEGVDVQSVIDNGTEEIPNFIPGAPVRIGGQLENRGDFRETQVISVKVVSGEETVYSEQDTVSLARRDGPDDPIGESEAFEFTWPTVGLETGDYEIIVQSPHSADEVPADNKYTTTVNLQSPPKVRVDIQDASGPYEVGEEIPVRAFVGREDQPFSGAAVSATLIRPSGEEEELSLDYNSESQLYESTFFANRGGNYRVEVQAQRAPYRPGLAEALFAQTYVDVSASLGSPTVEVGRTQVLRIRTSNVAGLYGFSADVIYDKAKLAYLKAAGSPLLSGGGDAETTVQAEDRGGHLVVGASRLDPEKGGVSSTQGGRIVSLGFVGRSAGEQTFSFEEVRLVDEEGQAMATRVTSSASALEVEEEPAAVSISVADTVTTATQRDTAQITLTNAFRAEGFGGTISFPSSSIRVVDVVEGTVFSENGDAETLFASDIDQQEGTAQFSITRTGDQPGISIGSAPVARLIYEPKAPGRSPIALEEGTVMSSRQGITLPNFTLDDTLAVTGAADSTLTTLSFSPSGRTPSQGETFSHAVTVENVTDLFSLATTVAFDPDLVNFVDIQEGNFLSENGDVSTSFTHDVDQSAGTIVTGLSRLGADVGGVSTEEPDTLFTLRFERTGEAQSQIELTNTGLLRPDGETEIPFKTEPARVNTPPTATRPVPPDTFKVPSPPVQLTNLGGTIFSDPGGDELAFSASSNAPSIVEATGAFSKTVMLKPQETGTAEVTVKASDGLSETDTSFSVTVEERAPSEVVPTRRGTAIVEAPNGDTAQVEFGGTGASATFQNLQSGGAADASFFDGEDDSPGTSSPFVPDDPFENVSPYRWKVSENRASSESVSLTLALGDPDVEGVQVPQEVTIIRDGQGNGTFEPVETTYDDGGTPLDTSDDALIAEGLSSFSTFRLASNNPDNSLGSSLSRPSRIGFEISRVFGDASGPADYRLVALPGQVERPLGDAVNGEAGSGWKAFWDDGSEQNYLTGYDGSDTFTFRPGRGFWLTSRQEWTVEDSVEVVSLGGDQAASIPVHEGWNIISNPLGEDTPWSTVQKAHSDTLQPAWAFTGSFQKADTLRSAATGQAYYFLNHQGLDSLTVPHPNAPKKVGKKTLANASQETSSAEKASMTLIAQTTNGLRSEVQVGIDAEAAAGLGPLDVVAPTSRFSALSLRLTSGGDANRDPRRSLLASEWRPPADETDGEKEGHSFSVRLRSQIPGPVEVRAEGLHSLKERRVALFRSSTGQSWDLQEKKAITLRETDSTALKLAVGSAAYVNGQEQKVVPDEVTLTSYPNPFRRQAIVEYTLPESKKVRLAVYDVLGRRVAVLEDGRRQAGRHRARLEGTELSSGVYFGRLRVEGQTLTQKITVVR